MVFNMALYHTLSAWMVECINHHGIRTLVERLNSFGWFWSKKERSKQRGRYRAWKKFTLPSFSPATSCSNIFPCLSVCLSFVFFPSSFPYRSFLRLLIPFVICPVSSTGVPSAFQLAVVQLGIVERRGTTGVRVWVLILVFVCIWVLAFLRFCIRPNY